MKATWLVGKYSSTYLDLGIVRATVSWGLLTGEQYTVQLSSGDKKTGFASTEEAKHWAEETLRHQLRLALSLLGPRSHS